MPPPAKNITVRIVDDQDFARKVAPRCGELLHAIVDNRFVRAMGPERMGELQRYAAFSKYGIVVVAMDGARVIGSGCAAYDSRKLLIDCALKRFWLFLPAIFASLLSPRAVVHMIRTFRYGNQDFMKDLPKAEYIYMNIDKEFRGTGVSDLMLQPVFEQLRQAGIRRIKGMSSEHNPRAHGFALGRGARQVDEANLYPERRSRVFVLDLDEYQAARQKKAAE